MELRVRGFTLVEIMIVVLIIGILLSIAIPQMLLARETSRAKACIANLTHIDCAKGQYIMDHNLGSFTPAQTPGDPTLGGLVPTYLNVTPLCPEHGSYNTGDFSSLPTCSIGFTSVVPHSLT
jgi:prepilin-type N-terminal cleavage/methylation domain-containing protein